MMSFKGFSDQELVEHLVAGDENAFTEIYSRYWKVLYLKAYAILRDNDVAQDAVQDVFISLWNRRATLKILYLRAYLHQAIRFKVLNFIREGRTDEQFYVRLRSVTTEIVAENPLLFKEQETLLQEVVASLPAECKEAFLLSREEELTYKQIAEQLNISIKTVEKRISKSLKHIRQNIDVEFCIAILFIMGDS